MGLQWYSKAVIFVFGLILFVGCRPKYFEIVSNERIIEALSLDIDFENSKRYRFQLRPAHFFKNNERTSVLVSDSSRFMRSNTLFTTDPRLFSFNDTPNYIDSSWFRIEVLLENQKPDLANRKIYIKTLSGKQFDIEERKWMADHGQTVKTQGAKLSNIYVGEVTRESSLASSGGQLIAIIDQAYRISYDKHKQTHEEPCLAFLFRESERQLVIEAVVDINYRKKGENPVIYDMAAIFGEPLWVNLINEDNE